MDAPYKLPVELSVAQGEITTLRARVAELEAEIHALQEAVNAEEERANDANIRATAELARLRQGVPLTANVLADAFDAMWNAAIGVSHERQEGIAVASMLAEGFAAMGRHLRESAALVSPGDGSFQDRVQPWMMACFGAEISADRLERGDRFLEEALELLQSGNYPKERVAALTDYVWSREVGDPPQEVGGVMVTLAAYCLAHGLDMHACGETELARVWTKVEKIRAKQAAKPRGSALPVAPPASEGGA